MEPPSHPRGGVASGSSQHKHGDPLEVILGRMNLYGGPSPGDIEEISVLIGERLNLDPKADTTRTMTMGLIEVKLSEMKLSAAGAAAPSIASPARNHVPRSAPSTRNVPGSFPQPPMKPPIQTPSSPIPRAFKTGTTQSTRGRSPARVNGVKIRQQSRSRTPNGFFSRIKRPTTPEPTAVSGVANPATGINTRHRSRSPHRGLSPSPLQRFFGGGVGASRYEKFPDEQSVPASSPSVYYEAHSSEDSLLESRTPPVSERGSQRILTPSGRPPLASVNMDPSATGNIMSPSTLKNPRRESGSPSVGASPPFAKPPTPPINHQPAGAGASPSRFNFDPNGDRFHIGVSPAKTKKILSPKRIKSPTAQPIRGLRASPKKLNLSAATATTASTTTHANVHTQQAAPASVTHQPTTPQESFPSPLDLLSPLTPLETNIKPHSFHPHDVASGKVTPAAASNQSSMKVDTAGDETDARGVPFASPIPPFQPPIDVFADAGPQGRRPTSGIGNWTGPSMMERRQTAPPQMEFAAASVSASMGQGGPNTPLDSVVPNIQQPEFAPGSVPDTCLPKKTRNTATPVVGDADPPKFNVDLFASTPSAKSKIKSKRGMTCRKGLGRQSDSASNVTLDIGGIPQPATDDTSPTAISETSDASKAPFFQHVRSDDLTSPSNASTGSEAMSIDSPHPSASASTPTGSHAAPAANIQFNIGVGDSSAHHMGGRRIGRRKETPVPRGFPQRSQSLHSVPTSSTFDSNQSLPHQPTLSTDSMGLNDPIGRSTHNSSSFGVRGINPNAQSRLCEKREELVRLRENGKSSYHEKAYRQAIEFNTKAIQLFLQSPGQNPSRGFLAILYSNRSAALMMVGAFEAAIEDCRRALGIASDPTTVFDSSDATPLLKPRLYARIARAFLRLGRAEDADRDFGKAIEWTGKLAMSTTTMPETEYLSKLDQVTTDCTLGKNDANQLRQVLMKITHFNEQSVNPRRVVERNVTVDALNDVVLALSIATGCINLHQMKVNLLADLKRWREVASHAERFAAGRVLADGCFVGDLASQNPLPTMNGVKYLRSDFFDSTKEADLDECQKTLNTTAAREAVLRLPYPMIPLYMRSLRLEERYATAEVCLMTLEQFVTENAGGEGREGLRSSFAWLPREKDKLIRTKAEREKGDGFYQDGKYDLAAQQYAACLLVDFEGSHFSDGVGAGGRLHAVLHCNRAACLMALKRNHEALTECTAALRIHPRYMKAILRRARCYSRLERFEEATEEYNRWLLMVRQARTDPNSFSSGISPCIFDGPDTISRNEENAVKQELDELLKVRAQAQAAERSRAAYAQQRAQWQSDRFNHTSYTSRNMGAERRREYFQSQQNNSRRWDSFADRGPNSSKSGNRSNPKTETVNSGSNDRTGTERSVRSPKEYSDNDSHYDVLQINITASVSDVKKAYRTMARMYHPDKNSDSSASDNFRRIQLAHDILTNPESRRKHDNDLRWRRR